MPRTQQPASQLRRIYERLGATQLSVSEQDNTLSLDELGLDSPSERVSLAFGIYSRQGLENALREYGMVQRIEERVGPLEVRLLFEDAFRPRIVFWSYRHQAPAVDICLRKVTGAEVGLAAPLDTRSLLYLDSFLLQHPGRWRSRRSCSRCCCSWPAGSAPRAWRSPPPPSPPPGSTPATFTSWTAPPRAASSL
jgi:hypothetical protein